VDPGLGISGPVDAVVVRMRGQYPAQQVGQVVAISGWQGVEDLGDICVDQCCDPFD
jgi:hypothetical protein